MQAGEDKLKAIKIESPCPKSWTEMVGSEQKRFCDQCDLHVHNVAAMQRSEAEALLAQRAQGAHLCVRLEFLPGGECITAETPQALRRGPGRIAAAALALGASLVACNSPVTESVVGEPATENNCEGEFELGKLPGLLVDTGEEPLELLGDVLVEQDLQPLMGEMEAPHELTGRPVAPPTIMGSPGPPTPDEE